MMTGVVLRADERLGSIDWPNLETTDVPVVRAGDCVLTCAGFEERSTETLRRIHDSGGSGFLLGIIDYRPFYPQNRIEELRALARVARVEAIERIYDRRDPSAIEAVLTELVKGFDRVVVDISGMSRLLIVQTVVSLIRNKKKVSIVYCEADDYPPSESEFRSAYDAKKDDSLPEFLSSGTIDIAMTPELSSVSMLGESIRLIAFPSFDGSQLTNLVRELQPTYVDVIYGRPPAEINRWREKALLKTNRTTLDSLHQKLSHVACTLDYRDTLRILLDIYGDRGGFDRMVVSPTGSKMQSVAVALVRSVLYDIQVVYPTPSVFTEPERHTVGVRRLYELDLPMEIADL